MLCFGIDGKANALDQMALALNKTGLLALGRKFCPTKQEKAAGVPACNYLDNENGQSRLIEFNGDSYFLCVCNDVFGVKKLRRPLGINVIVDLVHQFQPPGKGPSGATYYAKNGFAGAAKAWKCLVFGAVVFFNRSIPDNWPSGVRWTRGTMSTTRWKYKDNGIGPSAVENLRGLREGSISIRIFSLRR